MLLSLIRITELKFIWPRKTLPLVKCPAYIHRPAVRMREQSRRNEQEYATYIRFDFS